MSDYVGNPFFTLNGNEGEDLRLLFIAKMSEFADTIEASPDGEMVVSMLAPFLSGSGVEEIIPLLSASVLVSSLREASSVAENDEHAEGIVFSYYANNTLNVIMFNYEGKMAMKPHPFVKAGDTLGEQLFFEAFVNNALAEAAEEFNCQPLYQSSKVLSGVS